MTSNPQTRNLWPWAILIAFAVFIAGMAGLIVMACSQRTDLVSGDYYEQELRYQGQLDRVERTRQLQPPATVTYDAERRQLRISLPPDHARSSARGHIHLYRPAAASLDRRLKLDLDANGIQILETQDLRPGAWRIRVSWTAAGQEYFLDQRMVIGS
jgi:hypothetical protein